MHTDGYEYVQITTLSADVCKQVVLRDDVIQATCPRGRYQHVSWRAVSSTHILSSRLGASYLLPGLPTLELGTVAAALVVEGVRGGGVSSPWSLALDMSRPAQKQGSGNHVAVAKGLNLKLRCNWSAVGGASCAVIQLVRGRGGLTGGCPTVGCGHLWVLVVRFAGTPAQ